MLEKLNIKWPIQKKFIFLFILLYTFFYIFPFPLDAFPQLDFIFNRYAKVHDAFVTWGGKHILGIHSANKLPFSDSGDTAFDFANVFLFMILSVIIALTVLIIDKKRTDYEKIEKWLFIYIRYCIGFYMLIYGFDKIFKSHFPFPSLEKLEQPLGQSSPQGLLWAFMGYSTPYTIFLGIIEVASGFLLFFRRTTAIGSLLVLFIMMNVTVLNFCYDVPVKLFALHIVTYTCILLSPFFRSIFNFFILRKQVMLAEQTPPNYPPLFSKYRIIIKLLVIASFTLLFMNFSITNMITYGDSAPKPPLYGIYKATALPTANEKNVSEIIFDTKTTLIKIDGHSLYFETTVDTTNQIIHFKSNEDRSAETNLKYELQGNLFTLIEEDSVRIMFQKVDLNRYPLINRGFHWVVAYPENY